MQKPSQKPNSAQRRRTRIYQQPGSQNWFIYYREHGRTHRYTLGTSDHAEAERLQDALEADLLTRRGLPPASIPTAQFRSRHRRWLEQNHRRPKTIQIYEWTCDHFFSAVPHAHLSQFTPADTDTFKAVAAARGLAPTSVNIALRHVRAMFAQAVRWNLLPVNPYHRVLLLKTERRVPTFLTAAQVDRLLTVSALTRPYQLIVCLTALCGFRRNEFGAAIWSWFDFPAKTVTLQSRDDFRLKDWQARTVPLSQRAVRIILAHRPAHPDPHDYVIHFPQKTRARPDMTNSRTWRAITKQAGTPAATYQQLRSTFGSLLLQAGVSIDKISIWLGHSSTDVTRRHYAALTPYDQDIEKLS